MSLARAFTTRRAKVFGSGENSEGRPSRSHSIKGSISGPIRSKISGPVELVHTTNMLSYNAPDIHKEPKTAVSTSSLSLRSDGSSDHNPAAAYSPPTSPDSPFPHGDKDDTKSPGAVPNHLSCYFTLPGQSSATPSPPVPSIPKRAPSHTKRNYERKPSVSRLSESTSQEPLGRRPSVSRLSEQSSRTVSTKASFSFSRSSSTSTNTTASSHQSIGASQMPKISTAPPPVPPTALSTSGATQYQKEPSSAIDSPHPFGHELAQVTELAEEYASTAADKTRAMLNKEERDLLDSGLKKFTPEDYIVEIQGLFTTFFGEVKHARNPGPQWI
ncbi:hypothetical protein VMCG_01311 [Cytospora schulzeri]|uniref:Uncharacterized protein n=1 Tax=Cytospora schulzeri TaxID=448051 RepID=A0A423X719_9PEZI|nr:hypothetical protein VMCG_01311 [Valsa malicola]